ncbi:uncharacterized protein LOC142584290 isoform X3 [Dermacentor variabilis]|uniref:uncharacterized protein LOC142584290 isoform X3 n=1 Tax=Dermacentor variabilis TaxID=34621 RepID=UPI003F5B23DD
MSCHFLCTPESSCQLRKKRRRQEMEEQGDENKVKAGAKFSARQMDKSTCRNVGSRFYILQNYIIRIDYMVGTVGGGRRCATASCGRKGFKRAPNKSRRVWPAAEGQYGTTRHPCSAEQTWRTS